MIPWGNPADRSSRDRKVSYAQCGEDLIVEFIFECLKLSHLTYLDIGAHHPTFLSNTYLFYAKGHRGVCVEPDPVLFDEIARIRMRDVCLNVGVGVGKHSSLADFYIMTSRTLNTFSREEAERYESYESQKIERVVRLPLVPVNSIVKDHFDTYPNFVSLDVEGLDLEILKAFDFGRFRPEVFCVETLTYTEDKTEMKTDGVVELMLRNGYFIYADTYINTILVDERAWKRR